jgi:hypothetical protein
MVRPREQREAKVGGSRWIDRMALALLLGGSSATQNASAEDAGSGFSLSELETHGFVSQGYLRTTSNNYLAKSSSPRGSFEMAEVGLNFTQPLSDNLRTGIQLFARDLGPIGNYEIKADWFYLDYRWTDAFGVRAGRIKLPFGLYNEINDIDAAHVPILLPQSTYPARSRDYLLAQTGLEVYGRLLTGAAGALDYRAYGGTIFLDPTTPPGSPIVVQELTVPYLFGGRLLWETPLEGLRVGASAQKLRLDGTFLQGDMTSLVKIPALLWVASVEYAVRDLSLAAEYGRWHVSSTSSQPDNPAFNSKVDSERAYVMASLRVNDWFDPGAYYSLLFPNVKDRKGAGAQQHDVALTLRFDLDTHWLFKLEGHYMVGTADLDRRLNGGVPLDELTRRWGAFLAKTTAYF